MKSRAWNIMEHWQLITTLLIVAAAGLFLIRRIYGLCKGKSTGCGSGSCGHCPSAASQAQREVTTLDVSFSSQGEEPTR